MGGAVMLLLLWMCVCSHDLCTYVCVGGVWMLICEEAELNVKYFSQSILHLTSWDRRSLNLEFIDLVRIGWPVNPGSSCLPLISDGVTETCCCVNFFTWVLGIQVQLLGLCDKPFPDCVTHLLPWASELGGYCLPVFSSLCRYLQVPCPLRDGSCVSLTNKPE